jgi:ribosome-associated heat shock protein Hsp15
MLEKGSEPHGCLKSHSLATAACRVGHVRLNGERAKATQPKGIDEERRAPVAGGGGTY